MTNDNDDSDDNDDWIILMGDESDDIMTLMKILNNDVVDKNDEYEPDPSSPSLC